MNMRTIYRFILLTIVGILGTISASAQTGPLQFYTVAPCRVFDTRDSTPLGQSVARDFAVRGHCGIPTSAKAVSINITVLDATQQSYVALWPSGGTQGSSTINFYPGQQLANGAITPLSTNPNDLTLLNCCGTVNVILDVNGYFQ